MGNRIYNVYIKYQNTQAISYKLYNVKKPKEKK